MAFQYLILLISLLLLPTYILIKKNKLRDDTKPYPILGLFPQFLKNRHRSFHWFTELLSSSDTNTILFYRIGNTRSVITANPVNVEHVLKSDFDNFPKGPLVRFQLHDFLGNGIFNSDGHQWKAQRKTASHEFNTRSLRNFVVEAVQHETSTRLIPLLEKYAKSEQAFDIQNVLEKYSFDTICRVAFNADPACLVDDAATSDFADAFRDASSYSAGRFRYAIPGLWRIKKLLNIGSERRLKESISIVHDFATNIIRKRMKDEHTSSKHQKDDLLSRFIATGEYSEDFLRDIVISFLVAGRETTSSALSWFFWIVSSRQDIQNKILKEIKSIRAQNKNEKTQTFEFDELREMQYLHAAITESMRLYPPVPLNLTVCHENTTLPDGTKVKKGEFMSYNSYAMGRMEKVWGKDCREYKPERWIDENGMFRPESPFKFLAFHAGPRMCLGKESQSRPWPSANWAVAQGSISRGQQASRHLVMELCKGGELFDRIVARGHYTERAAAAVTKTIVEVVQVCHKHGVMHRDLKPENFLFANKKETAALKAIDFGLSVFFKPGERFTEIVGSPYYMAPEVLKRNYGPEVDVWSAGVILYILLCGVPPFWAETEQGVAQAIIRSVVDFKRDPWPIVSDNAKDLVKRMLNTDPKKRLTAQEVLDHPWLQNAKKAPNVNLGETVKARLQQFSMMNKLKKRALKVIAEHLSVEEVADIKDTFSNMDVNNNGKITLEELKHGLNKLGHQIPDADVKILMDAADADGNGTLDYGEFVAVSVHLRKIGNDEHLHKAFTFFDQNKSGYIEIEELRECLADDLAPNQEEIITAIIRDVDTDKDGKISYEEFAAMMKAGTDWRKASRQYSRERFNNLSLKLMKDGSLQLTNESTR